MHVGMPDPETAIASTTGLRAHLPLLQALAGDSPFWHGIDSGLASARALIFRAFPRSTSRPPFANWEDYDELVELVRRHRRPRRLHVPVVGHPPQPSSGRSRCARWTRSPGWRASPASPRSIHALAVACADGGEEKIPPPEAMMESRFRAARDGIDATVWWRGAIRPIPEVGADALEVARPYARDLDGEDALEEVERILREGGGAERMREAYAAGGMDELLARLVAETYGSTQTTSPIRSQS